MPAVLHNSEVHGFVDGAALVELKQAALRDPRGRARLCLHHQTTDLVQEMILAFANTALMPPHRNPEKTESVHVIEGTGRLLIFDGAGKLSKTVDIGPVGSGLVFLYRLSTIPWHTVIPESETLVLHEVLQGPFVVGETVFPAWAPTDAQELQHFLAGR